MLALMKKEKRKKSLSKAEPVSRLSTHVYGCVSKHSSKLLPYFCVCLTVCVRDSEGGGQW